MREIQQGDSWFHTRETALAAVLTALDFEFWDPENCAQVIELKGKREVTWLYQPNNKDSTIQALEVYRAWKDSDNYCNKKTHCRIASAIAAAKNLKTFNKQTKDLPAQVCYELGSKKFYVTKDSEKDIKLSKHPSAEKL